MDWFIGLQKAIDYIEDNLTETIDYEMVAAQSFSSSYHFQRVFSILCGFTIGEYIRNRRLSLAGTELATGKAKVLDVALKYGYLPKGEDFDFTFRMAAVLHTIILSKGMTADNMNPGWDTEDAIEHAGNAEWGYSCCNIPEITTTMRHGAVFFSNNRNLTLMNTDVRRIVTMIKPFSDAKNLKIATALYQLTIHSEDAYTTVAQISDKSGVSPEKVQDCLESDLSQFILEKEGPESQFRFEGMYMNILPIISLFDFK